MGPTFTMTVDNYRGGPNRQVLAQKQAHIQQ